MSQRVHHSGQTRLLLLLLALIGVSLVVYLLRDALWGSPVAPAPQTTAAPTPASASEQQAAVAPVVTQAPPATRTLPPAPTVPAGSEVDETLHRFLVDLDGDGLTNRQEDVNGNRMVDPGETDFADPDTDGDGKSDGVEREVLASDPLDPEDPGLLSDRDMDGLPVAFDPDDRNPDVDGDRFTDGYEATQISKAAVTDPHTFPPLGDLNGDGAISNADALALQRVYLKRMDPAKLQLESADANLDGRVNHLDALILQSFYMQHLPTLPLLKQQAAQP